MALRDVCEFIAEDVPRAVDDRRSGAGVLPLMRLRRDRVTKMPLDEEEEEAAAVAMAENDDKWEWGWAVVLGLENDGNYTGLYNLLCGSRDYRETAYQCARREGFEESCGLVSLPLEEDEEAKSERVLDTVIHSTCIYVYHLKEPIKRSDFKDALAIEKKGKRRASFLEMDDLGFFWVDKLDVSEMFRALQYRSKVTLNLPTTTGRIVPVTSFAVGLLKTVFGDHVRIPVGALL